MKAQQQRFPFHIHLPGLVLRTVLQLRSLLWNHAACLLIRQKALDTYHFDETIISSPPGSKAHKGPPVFHMWGRKQVRMSRSAHTCLCTCVKAGVWRGRVGGLCLCGGEEAVQTRHSEFVKSHLCKTWYLPDHLTSPSRQADNARFNQSS